MTEFEQNIFDVFIDRGITLPDWRIKIASKEIIKNSDYARVLVEVYKPRKRKPCIVWDLCVNFVREQINWDHSTFARKD